MITTILSEKDFYRSSSGVGNGGGLWTTFAILLTKITQKSIAESPLTKQLKSRRTVQITDMDNATIT